MTTAASQARNAYELIDTVDADVVSGPEAVLDLAYECPDCGHGIVKAATVGCRAQCYCPECSENSEADDFPIYGIHDILGQYVIEGHSDYSLRDVPADRVVAIDGEDIEVGE